MDRLSRILDGFDFTKVDTVSWKDVEQLRSSLSSLALQYAVEQNRESDAKHDLIVVLEKMLDKMYPLRWTKEIRGYWQLPPFSGGYVECETCFHVRQGSEECQNNCKSKASAWELSSAPADILLLCRYGRSESATVVAASYYEGLLFSLFCKALQVRCVKHWAEDLDGKYVSKRWEKCKECGKIKVKRTIDSLYGTKWQKPQQGKGRKGKGRKKLQISRGMREDGGCEDVFGETLPTMIDRLSLDVSASDFDAMREEIMGHRHMYVHRGIFHGSILCHETPASYQRMEQAIRFVLSCWKIFREIQNEHITQEALSRFDKANRELKNLRTKRGEN